MALLLAAIGDFLPEFSQALAAVGSEADRRIGAPIRERKKPRRNEALAYEDGSGGALCTLATSREPLAILEIPLLAAWLVVGCRSTAQPLPATSQSTCPIDPKPV